MARKKSSKKKVYEIPSRSSLSLESLSGPLAQAEKKVLVSYLIKHKGNILRTAYELYLNRNTLTKLIHRHGIDIKKIREGKAIYEFEFFGDRDKQGMLEKGSSQVHGVNPG